MWIDPKFTHLNGFALPIPSRPVLLWVRFISLLTDPCRMQFGFRASLTDQSLRVESNFAIGVIEIICDELGSFTRSFVKACLSCAP